VVGWNLPTSCLIFIPFPPTRSRQRFYAVAPQHAARCDTDFSDDFASRATAPPICHALIEDKMRRSTLMPMPRFDAHARSIKTHGERCAIALLAQRRVVLLWGAPRDAAYVASDMLAMLRRAKDFRADVCASRKDDADAFGLRHGERVLKICARKDVHAKDAAASSAGK